MFTCHTFEWELSGDSFSSNFVCVDHGHLCSCLPQGMSECSAYPLTSTRYVSHLSIKTQPIKDGAPLDSTENLIIGYFTLTNRNKISRRDQWEWWYNKARLSSVSTGWTGFYPNSTCVLVHSEATETRQITLMPSLRGIMTFKQDRHGLH